MYSRHSGGGADWYDRLSPSTSTPGYAPERILPLCLYRILYSKYICVFSFQFELTTNFQPKLVKNTGKIHVDRFISIERNI